MRHYFCRALATLAFVAPSISIAQTPSKPLPQRAYESAGREIGAQTFRVLEDTWLAER